ncbi:MAG: heat-inducible transcription repressor HrcA [Eubacterium sp.]|jgi:heat-inducible transcriptional repressor|nr:heat-inducible transcription repressor HrcA [Eubacterium sp.]
MSVLVIEGLDERKTKILKAIIKNYLDTGEPVGSRTISKYTDLHLSSATIRNEMSDLEELGYILQPHTSAGRIPSDKGYRFYVDNLIAEKNQEISDMQNFVIEHTEKMEKVLKSVAKLLANNTEYAAMITGPQYHHRKLKFIQLSNVDAGQLLCVIVLEGNVVKNKMLAVDEALNDEQLLKMNILLNTSLNGLSLEQINLGTIAALKDQAGAYSSLAADVLDAVAQALGEDEDLQIYTSGATNIFKYPELSNSEKASEFISAFEEKQMLANMITDKLENRGPGTGIQVYIGDESPIKTMKDCSVVTAAYELGEGVTGMIGIIGPKRMDYERVLHNLKNIKKQLDIIYHKDEKPAGG